MRGVSTNMSVFQRLLKIARPYRSAFITGLGFLVVTTTLETAIIPILFTSLLFLVIGSSALSATGPSIQAFGLERYLNHMVGSTDQTTLLIRVSLIIVFIYLIKCAGKSRQFYLMNKFSYLTAMDLRKRLFAHVISLSPAQFDKHSSGNLLSRMTWDVAVIQDSLGVPVSEIIEAPLTIVIALGIMLAASWKLTLSVLCLAPVIALLIAWMGKAIRKLTISIQERLGALNAHMSELLSGMRVIQSFTSEPYEKERVNQLNQHYYQDSMRSVLIAETIAQGVEFAGILGMIIGVIIAGILVFKGGMPSDRFMLFLFMAQKVSEKFTKLARMNQLRQKVNGAGTRIFELLDMPPTIEDAPDAKPLTKLHGHVTFENVSFGYSQDSHVLSDINFAAKPDEVIALVGPSGAGKTTLVNLLPRFYDPTSGRILIDGQDLRSVTLRSLRQAIGTVPQETLLFSGTIDENIRYGNLDAPDEEVIAAARAANALEFIEKMPDGLQTVVGERGARLSGGQRQRIAIARALLKNPRILILDEATSALDTESEHLVQQALENLMGGRTTFIIAHRLSTIQYADRIMVLENGRIVEIGNHNELLSKGGLYSRLYEMQFHNSQLKEPLLAE